MTKPIIRFGYKSDIIDANFYKYDIQERLDFIRSHFRNGKEFEVLPYIDNNDTTLTFILKKSSIPSEL
ncbi:MAG: hypothetical protein E7Y34_01535, partial [Mycoplasma sp.]|nr:hypothetical protein [Mycoplasma sp.]